MKALSLIDSRPPCRALASTGSTAGRGRYFSQAQVAAPSTSPPSGMARVRQGAIMLWALRRSLVSMANSRTWRPWASLACNTASAPAPAPIRVATAISQSSLDRIRRRSQLSQRTEVEDGRESCMTLGGCVT